ncbi:MAG: tetratricopeptide repeat protein, partial [Phycisphaerales bacterium JB039]
ARVIRDRQPARPSSTTTGVRGEIDWIVRKALEKEPPRRYQSASELARDIRAYLSGDSVSARPPTLLYQARVLARRHRAAAAAIVVGVIMLAIAATGTTAGLIQAERHRQLEQKALVNAIESLDEIRDLSTAINPATGRGREMAIETLDAVIGWAEGMDFEHQPALQAAVLTEIGRTQLTLGLYIPATNTLLGALELADQAFPRDDLHVAEVLDSLGAALLHSMRPGVTPEQLWRRSLEIYRANFPEESPEVARAKYQLALAVLFSDEGRQLLEEALATQREMLGEESAETLATMTRLAWRYMDLGEEGQAEPLFRTALEAQRRTLGDNHPAVASTLLSLGEMLGWYDRDEEAERLMGEALAIRRAVLGPEHPATAEAERIFAGAVEDRGDLETAAAMLEHAEGVLARNYPPPHNSLFWTRRALGRILTGLGRHEEAIAWLTLAIDDQKDAEGKPTHNAGWGRASLAETYWAMGRQSEAIDQMRRAIEVMLATGRPGNNRLLRAQATLATWLDQDR